MESAEVLKEIAQQVAVCERCQLSHSRKNSVPGEGPANAEIMLIGEGPGFYENEQGRPFVGAAGKFLDELLQNAGVKRGEVFITNVVKCRPPANRDPLPEELMSCNDYLERQIQAINPLVIITLGRYSMARFIPNVKISAVHGQPRWIGSRLIVPMFHPAAALHQPALKSSVLQDFSHLPQWIGQAKKARAQGAGVPGVTAAVKPAAETPHAIKETSESEPGDPPATQLSLF
jgi:uracil-DNA glycosylase